MQKFVSLLLILGLVFSLAACSDESETKKVKEGVKVDIDEAPSAPTNLSSAATSSGIKLSWDDTGGKYLIYRGREKNNLEPLFSIPISKNSYTDYSVNSGMTYYYAVQAISKQGINGARSSVISAKQTEEVDGIRVHFKDTKGTPNIYIWYQDSNGKTQKPFGGWPGKEMTKEGNGWYQAQIDRDKINLIFIDSQGSKTDDLARTTGEWWYKDGQWYNNNPDTASPPTISIEPANGNYSGVKKINISVSGSNILNTACKINGNSIELKKTKTVDLSNFNQEQFSIYVTAVNDYGETEKKIGVKDFTLHYKHTVTEGTPNIYTWLKSNGQKLSGGWPGKPMTAEGNDWYTANFENVLTTELNCKLNWSQGTGATENLSITGGEWWYKNGMLYDYNPEQ